MSSSKSDRELHPTRRRAISRYLFGILLAVSSVLFILVIRPFLMPLLLSAITAGVFFPLKQFLLRRSPERKSLATIVTMIAVILVVVIPISGLVYIAALNITRLAHTVSTWGPDVHRMLESILRFGQQLGIVQSGPPQQLLSRDVVLKTLQQYSTAIAGHISILLGNAVRTLLAVLVYLYSLFFFLRDGDRILGSMLNFIPLDSEQKDLILSHFVSVTRATVKGTVVMGVIQGSVAYVGYLVAGLHTPLLWGILTGLLAALPNFGPILIWLPAGLLLALNGHTAGAVVVFAGVGGLMGVSDYFVRPRIIGDDIKMHDLLVFLGIFGGIALFRLPGILVGPIIMATFVQMWTIFRMMYENDFRAANALRGPRQANFPTE